MSTSYSVHVGRYIKVKSLVVQKMVPKTINVCSRVGCENSDQMKDLGNVNYCFLCGNRIVPLESTETENEYLRLGRICFDLFGHCNVFEKIDDCIFCEYDTDFSKRDFAECKIDLSDMLEYMKNKTEDDAIDILSKHLTNIGVENEIKFGVVGYYC